jgi:6-phosphogluconate dehydrogenase
VTRAIVIIGASGSGKSTLAQALARRLGWSFIEGDSLHPPANVAKMASGISLDDADRAPFLRAVAQAIGEAGGPVVVACSALKRSYRDVLRDLTGPAVLLFVWPRLYRDTLAARLTGRAGHFMPVTLLDSQLAAFEAPGPDEHALAIDGTAATADQVDSVLQTLQTSAARTDPEAMKATRQPCDIGLIGLAVMGENLALNIERRGHSVCVYNRTAARTLAFTTGRGAGRRFTGATTLQHFVASLATPRRVLMLVKAGSAVDELIAQLLPLLAPGDVLVDCGNSLHTDTMRRTREVEARGLLYVGCGVSGGEEGALNGPSMMPGGSSAAWPLLRPVFEAICARTPAGEPCVRWIGADGAGHFVKMVHNGIEYGDMQLIAETYDVMRRALRMDNDAMAGVFAEWNAGELDSYLVGITRDILAFRDEGGEAVVDRILDAAGQKGTGRWTVNAALEEGVPLPLTTEAVFARSLSAARDERVAAAAALVPPPPGRPDDARGRVEDLRAALYASKIVSYAQGFALLRAAAATNRWQLDPASIALTWRAGCIIRSVFLGEIRNAFARDPALPNLVLDPFFAGALRSREAAWRRAVSAAVMAGIPVPCLSAALAWWDACRCTTLPANLLQAQRDYFGAHTYERTDRPRGQYFHTDWTGHGGSTTSQSYNR